MRRRVLMLKLLHKIVGMDNDRLTKQIFLWDWKHKGRTWSYNIRCMLRMANVDINSDLESLDYSVVIKTVKEKLLEQEIVKWREDKDRQSKLRLYRQLKDSFCTELYISKNMSKSCRSFIAQLRSSTLPINIEIGRFQQKAVENRICPCCNENKIEDEIHFLFNCPLYAGTRIVFMQHVKIFYPDISTKSYTEQLQCFMNDTNLICKLGAFIRDCYFIRNTYIYSVKK